MDFRHDLLHSKKTIHRSKVFENGLLRRILGFKGGKIARGWRKLDEHQELHNIHLG
jgi:hypothetical protein